MCRDYLRYARFSLDGDQLLGKLGTQLEWEVETSTSAFPQDLSSFFSPVPVYRDEHKHGDEKLLLDSHLVGRTRHVDIECVELPFSTVSPICYFDPRLARSLLHSFTSGQPEKELLAFKSVYPDEYVLVFLAPCSWATLTFSKEFYTTWSRRWLGLRQTQ